MGPPRSAWSGSREASRVALSPRRGECGDADGPAEWDRTAHHRAAHGGLAAVGRVAQREPRQLDAAANRPTVVFETRRRDPIDEARDFPIEPRQLALADHVCE